MLGKSPIKWRQRPNMTIAVDGDVQRQFKETNKISYSMFTCPYFRVYVGKQNKFPVFKVIATMRSNHGSK